MWKNNNVLDKDQHGSLKFSCVHFLFYVLNFSVRKSHGHVGSSLVEGQKDKHRAEAYNLRKEMLWEMHLFSLLKKNRFEAISQRCTLEKQAAEVTSWNTENSDFTWGKKNIWKWSNTETDFPEMLWNFFRWRHSGLN